MSLRLTKRDGSTSGMSSEESKCPECLSQYETKLHKSKETLRNSLTKGFSLSHPLQYQLSLQSKRMKDKRMKEKSTLLFCTLTYLPPRSCFFLSSLFNTIEICLRGLYNMWLPHPSSRLNTLKVML